MNLNKLTSGFALAFLVLILASCGENTTKSEIKSTNTEAARMEVSIGGMSCTGCEQTIQTNLEKLDGIKSVKASFTVGNATIEYYPGIVDSLKIKEVITASGYKVKKFSTIQP